MDRELAACGAVSSALQNGVKPLSDEERHALENRRLI